MSEAVPVGVIGIGAMGMGVAMTLLRNGFPVWVRDVRAHAEEHAAGAGAQIAPSPADLARHCEIVILLVVNDAQVEDVVFAPGGVCETLTEGSVVLLSSTVAPAFAASVARRLEQRSVWLLDAPVSGGPAQAHTGKLSMMAAGPAPAFAKTQHVLSAFTSRLFRIGNDAGDGSKVKIVNNMLAAINLAAGCEAMALGMKLGLDPHLLYEVVCASSGASWIFGDRMPRMLAGDYAPRAAINILTKDLGILLETGLEADFALPVASAAYQRYLAAMQRGLGAEDDAALIKTYSTAAGIDLPGKS